MAQTLMWKMQTCALMCENMAGDALDVYQIPHGSHSAGKQPEDTDHEEQHAGEEVTRQARTTDGLKGLAWAARV